MQLKTILPILVFLAFTLNSCFKDEPTKETYRAAGSWRVDKVTIQKNDSLGNNLTSDEINTSPGMLLLTHNDDFEYQDPYSSSLDSDALTESLIYKWISMSNTWGLGVEAKTFNLGSLDPETGYVTRIASLTVLKFSKHKMELQYVRVDPTTGFLTHVEVWYLKRATH